MPSNAEPKVVNHSPENPSCNRKRSAKDNQERAPKVIILDHDSVLNKPNVSYVYNNGEDDLDDKDASNVDDSEKSDSEAYVSQNKSVNMTGSENSLPGFKVVEPCNSANLKPMFMSNKDLPSYLEKIVVATHIPVNNQFSAAHSIPEIMMQLVKGITPTHDTIVPPLMQLDKVLMPHFSDSQFEVLQDHLSNEYRINKVPFAAFLPYIRNTNSANLNLIRLRNSLISLWNFSSVLPNLMASGKDLDFNKFVYNFFVPPLVNLFQAYQSQVYTLRSLAWPRTLKHLKLGIIRAPLSKGSLWTLTSSDLKSISEASKPKPNSFFRGRSNRRFFRRPFGRSRFRGNSNFRWQSFHKKSNQSEKTNQ